MSSGTALFVQHERGAPPAMLAEAFADAGFDTKIMLVSDVTGASLSFPDPRDFDVIVPLGATLSVYDPNLIRSWVGAEMDMLRAADAAGVPVLGVCFGGQLLAQTHGGRVARSDRPEIGWYLIESDNPAVVSEGPWFQWHYDRWTTPPEATEIARNANASQAFVLRRSLALQFHPELDDDLLTAWLGMVPKPRLNGAVLDTALLRRQTKAHRDGAAQRVRDLVKEFLAHVAK